MRRPHIGKVLSKLRKQRMIIQSEINILEKAQQKAEEILNCAEQTINQAGEDEREELLKLPYEDRCKEVVRRNLLLPTGMVMFTPITLKEAKEMYPELGEGE